MSSLSKRLKELRLEKDLSQEKLGDLLEISRSAITRYECGDREPDFYTLQKIADFFDVSADYLLGRTNVKIIDLEKHKNVERLLRAAHKAKNLPENKIDHLTKVLEFLIEEEKND